MHKLKPKLPFIVIGIWFIFLTLIYSRMLQLRSDGLYAGHPYVWSDWALHVSMAQIFATKDPSLWFAYHPIYAGGKFTYGFLTNLISGLLMRVGIPIDLAFNIPSVLFSAVLLLSLFFLGEKLTKSYMSSALGISIFFLSSGWGFITFITDFLANPSLRILTYPPQEYSKYDLYAWGSGNFLTGMLVPQRAFLLGMVLAICSLLLLINGLELKNIQNKKRLLVLSGICAGLLPITHMHSYIALGIVSAVLLLPKIKQWKTMLWFGIPAVGIGVILYLHFISGGIENPNFMQWLPGWTSADGFLGWLHMWWRLWGIMLPLVIGFIIFFRKQLPANLLLFSLASLIVFIIPNLILLQPVHWDNSKLFLWAYLGFSFLVSYCLILIWKRKLISKLIVLVLLFILTGTGLTEVIRLGRIDKNTYQMISRKDMDLMDTIRSNTDPLTIFLTAPSHNHPITMWAARPIVLGYTSWVWNFGFLYQQREIDVKNIYEATTDIQDLIHKYNIGYIYIGPEEERRYDINLQYFLDHFPIAFSNSDTFVFDTGTVMTGK